MNNALDNFDQFQQREVAILRAENQRLLALLEKALTRSAIVHPGFADEIRAALSRKETE